MNLPLLFYVKNRYLSDKYIFYHILAKNNIFFLELGRKRSELEDLKKLLFGFCSIEGGNKHSL